MPEDTRANLSHLTTIPVGLRIRARLEGLLKTMTARSVAERFTKFPRGDWLDLNRQQTRTAKGAARNRLANFQEFPTCFGIYPTLYRGWIFKTRTEDVCL